MAKQNVGNTTLGAAVCRLIEQFQPEEARLFNDPVVKYLVGTSIRGPKFRKSNISRNEYGQFNVLL